MIPGRYDIEVYQGDSYRGPLIALPDLSPFGGPSDLSAATVEAQVRETPGASVATSFAVEVVDPLTRELRLRMTPAQTLAAPVGVWDLQVTQGAFVGTVLAGVLQKIPQVTR